VSVYYNENDPNAAAWLRELMFEDLIPWGEVDERSIEDVCGRDLAGYTQCHFFAGIGGWPYALRLAGWGDRPVWTGSCPCQPFSIAGRGKGFADRKHLWPVWHDLIAECKPPSVFGEQVASKQGLAWLDAVYADLENTGYAVGAADLCAAGVGAPHTRQRLYWTASLEYANSPRLQRLHEAPRGKHLQPASRTERWSRLWVSEPALDRMADGVPGRVGLLRGYGNAIVPQVAQAFIEAYMSL
jgi:DNA (cytosine-5)-methyltransferase 1